MYLTNTRPDICFAVNTLSQYLVKPRRVQLIVAKHVMRYLKGTINLDFTMVDIMTTDCIDIQIHIGQEMSQTKRAPQVDVFV